MKTNLTAEDILSRPCGHLNGHLRKDKPEKKKRAKLVSKEKTWMQFRLEEFSRAKGLELHTEFKFDLFRRWKFDWCFPKIKVAIEYEGIFSAKSRHTTATGFTGEKYNSAQQQGWRVLRFTALNYLDLVIELNNLK